MVRSEAATGVLSLARSVLGLALFACFLGLSGCVDSPVILPPPTGLDALQPSTPVWAQGTAPLPGVDVSDQGGVSMPWRLFAISDDRSTITVGFVVGDGFCLQHAGYGLQIEGDVITLSEFSTQVVPNGSACPAMLVRGVETVPLPMALDGDVILVHAPTQMDASMLD